jgi:hypothetical protein
VRGGLTFGFTKDSQFQFRNMFGLEMRARPGEDALVRRKRVDSQVVVVF